MTAFLMKCCIQNTTQCARSKKRKLVVLKEHLYATLKVSNETVDTKFYCSTQAKLRQGRQANQNRCRLVTRNVRLITIQ